MQTEAETSSLLKLSEISLTLERYEDIFSSFDSRPYAERALSEDFLHEAMRASIEKNEVGLELHLLVPKKMRKEHDEHVIKERLKLYFKKHYHQVTKEKQDEISLGLRMVLLGVFFMFVATYMLFTFGSTNLFISFIIVILEPAGWFTFWEGLNEMLFKSKEKNHYLNFYRKMEHAQIFFKGY